MIADAALCICSAQPGTGIHAAPADAGSVYRTVRVHLTLWPAVGRGAQHSGQAGALALLPVLARWQGVRTTGVWLAGILLSNIRCNCYRCGEHAKFEVSVWGPVQGSSSSRHEKSNYCAEVVKDATNQTKFLY